MVSIFSRVSRFKDFLLNIYETKNLACGSVNDGLDDFMLSRVSLAKNSIEV